MNGDGVAARLGLESAEDLQRQFPEPGRCGLDAAVHEEVRTEHPEWFGEQPAPGGTS